MEREIKFRGKSILTGMFIEGNLVIDRNRETSIIWFNSEQKECWTSVCPYSVGQYTGLKDTNGKEIYEGDIVGSNGFIHIVTYVENLAGFGTISKELPGSYGILDQRWIDYCDIVIVGNIHDNPELLKWK